MKQATTDLIRGFESFKTDTSSSLGKYAAILALRKLRSKSDDSTIDRRKERLEV